MSPNRFLTIALLSVSLIALELSWTRILSAEFFYTFAFLVLSLAILGLGLGALVLRLCRFFNHSGWIGVSLWLSGLMILIGPVVVFQLGLDFSTLFSSGATMVKMLAAVVTLSSPFFFAGIGLALMFKQNHRDMPRLYMADLCGAGGGVIVAIVLMNHFGTPAASVLIAVPILVASMIAAERWMKLVPLVLCALTIALAPRSASWLEAERRERGPVIYKHWDAMAKVKVFGFSPEYRGIEIDNVANTPVIQFDGDYSIADTADLDWGINVSYLIDKFDSCTFLSLGAGGGGDVLQALLEGAAEIHAVEVNPHLNRMMLFGDSSGYIDIEPTVPDSPADDTTAVATIPPGADFRDSTGSIVTMDEFSGYIYHHPKVKVVTEDARTYIRRFNGKFDIIYSLASNSWAALGSGSFALAENYLYTTEAFKDYWSALSDSGFMSMEHQVYMPRIVCELMQALEELGVADPMSHFAVYDLTSRRRKLLLISKRPLSEEIRNLAYGELSDSTYDLIHLVYPAPDSIQDNLYNQIVLNGWRSLADTLPIDISPCTDNRPFVAQMGRWDNLDFERANKLGKWAEFYGFPMSKLIILFIMAAVLIVIVPLNILPYFKKGEKLKAVPWLYFFAIGMAFMMLEIVLIQKYALFIGASVYSIATVLLTLLLASGIGSRYSRRFGDAVPFIGIAVWLLLDIFVHGFVTGALIDLAMPARAAVTAGLVFPLGFFMGMPFPKGTFRVGALVDWGFAVNGAASVLGSMVVLLVAFAYGFTVALILGGLCYLGALGLMSLRKAW
ncbi:MAG: hypothetical protein OEV49_03610 [candidate division Zixibacteria bacterium]|nr:hypothetical protein [candidate division Zixibacteria bacterium]